MVMVNIYDIIVSIFRKKKKTTIYYDNNRQSLDTLYTVVKRFGRTFSIELSFTRRKNQSPTM